MLRGHLRNEKVRFKFCTPHTHMSGFYPEILVWGEADADKRKLAVCSRSGGQSFLRLNLFLQYFCKG